jgi:acylphosphatase
MYCQVHGKVQGVGFRAFVLERARSLGLVGWVRNSADGLSVELVADGDAESLAQLQAALRSGPPSARVDHVACAPSTAAEHVEGFQIRR